MALVRMNLKKKKAGKDAAEFWQRYKEVVSGQEVDLKKDLQVLGEGLCVLTSLVLHGDDADSR